MVLGLIEFSISAATRYDPSAQISLVTRRKLILRRCDLVHFV